jgi:hypothetical protein
MVLHQMSPLFKEVTHGAHRHRISFRAEPYDNRRGDL